MGVVQRNGLVVVSYQKISKIDLHDKNPRIRSRNSFTIEVEEYIGALLERVERNLSAYGINFQGGIKGGSFEGRGIGGRYYVDGREITKEECDLPTSDAGKTCTDSSQCESGCFTDHLGATSGKCGENTVIVGCGLIFVENGKTSGGALCAD